MVTELVLTEEERELATAIAARTKSGSRGAEVLEEVAVIFDVKVAALLSDTKTRRLVDARTVVTLVLYRRGWTVVEIGDLLGRDHSTICHLMNERPRKDDGLRSILAEFPSMREELAPSHIYEPAAGWSR